MKVLVATKETQGLRRNDFFWTEEGEFVSLPFECDGEGVDGSCGCRRSFSGLRTSKATTTAEVVEKEMSPRKFVALFVRARVREGWLRNGDLPDRVIEEAKEMLRLAGTFPAGAVVERRGAEIIERRRAT